MQVVHALPEPLYTAADIGVIRQGPAIAQMRLHGRRILDETAEEVHRRFPPVRMTTAPLRSRIPRARVNAVTALGWRIQANRSIPTHRPTP